jgi:hypothetical protein
MAGQTPNYGLNYFGGDVTGSLGDDSDKFTGEDRLALDRWLAALASHSHHPAAALPEPEDELELELTTGLGSLEGGTTYYYLVSFVGPDGLETTTGPESSLTLPDILPTPDPPAANTPEDTDGITGTLIPGNYFYAITGLRDDEESPISDPASVTVIEGDTGAVVLTLPELDDAEEYQVWRMADTDGGWTRIGQTANETFTDDGSMPSGIYGDPANNAPLVNTGVANYSVTVTLSEDDQVRMANAAAWRIYRSEFSGVYGAQTLVHEVIETTDPVDPETPVVTSWIDDGDPLLVGSPKSRSQEMRVEPFTFEHHDPLPATTGYPEYYAIFGPDNAMYANIGGAWTPVTAGDVQNSSRGVAVFTGTGPPDPEPEDAEAGDLYIDLSSGDLYTLDGP